MKSKSQTLERKPRQALTPPAAPHEPDLAASLDLVMRLMAVPGPSGREAKVSQLIASELRRAGVRDEQLQWDNAHQRTLIPGEIGNLVCKLPGTLRGPRRLLMAHIDTVPLCEGSQPVRKGAWVESADPRTGLGADDRSGAAVVLQAALTILRRKLPHPPLTFYWTVQEEVGLQGVRHATLGLLGKPRLAFNWDGGPAEKLTVGATGAYRMQIVIEGLASHAGGSPERGVSAIGIAGLAIAELQREGWHGDISRDGRRGTSNLGLIQGGEATNVVAPRVEVRAEARSHDPQFRLEIVAAIEGAFRRAAAEVRNIDGVTGNVQIERRLDYENFVLDPHEPCVTTAEAAIRAVGGEPLRAISNGGLDANWMTARGIPTVTLGCGQNNVHTASERLNIAAYEMACRVALRLATASE
ncbi:MAG: M20/M25/M40 family metallo-hydrolase [Planctomycetaceae bacterium]|nr:M20/M25/M40 family metallo-hydrolase [Planctomycetaceae bacterium]